jgi:hypothetical protein
MRSQHIAAVVSVVCFVIGAAIALTASHGVPAGWWDYPAGLKIALPGFALGIAGAAAGALWLWRALALNNSSGWKFGAPGLVCCAVLAFIPLNHLWLYFMSPPIHDVSTDPEYPPLFAKLLPLRTGAQNGPDYDGMKLVTYRGKQTHVAMAQKKAYPDIKPYVALLNPRQEPGVHPVTILFWRGFERAKDEGFDIAGYDEKDGTIEATHQSFWFGLIEDIAIRVKPAGKIGARLDIRAQSRTGENDMGATAATVRDYLKALK